jgi:uncharacterized small protein (DUF1192 family)
MSPEPSSGQDPLGTALRKIGHPEQRIEDLEREVERLRAALAARPATEVSASAGVETGGPGALGRELSGVQEASLPPLDPVATASDAIDLYAEALPEHGDHDIAKATAMREVEDAATVSSEVEQLTPEEAALLAWLMGYGDRPGDLLGDNKAQDALLAKLRRLAALPVKGTRDG